MAPPTSKDEDRHVLKLLGCEYEVVVEPRRRPDPSRDGSNSSSPHYGLGVLNAVNRIGRRVRGTRNMRKTGDCRDGGGGGGGGGADVEAEEGTPMCLLEENPYLPLKEAAKGDLEVFRKTFTSDPSRLTTRNNKGQTVLHVATASGHLSIVQFIMQQSNVELNAADNVGDTALHTAVRHDQPEIVEVLLQAGADHTLTNQQKMAPLHVACDLGYVNVVKVMVSDPNVDKNQMGEMGLRPLHYCSFKDNADCAAILLENGGKPCTKCDFGNFPIHIAAKSAAVRTMEVIIQTAIRMGYDRDNVLSFRDKANNMPLHAAVIGGNIQAVEVCLRAGAPVNAQQDDKSTPVHFAAAQGNLAMMQMMYTWQSDNFTAALSITDAMSMTPLHRAALFNHKAMVPYLLEKGADINSVDCNGSTPLLLAAGKGCWDTVEVLVDRGADVRVRNKHSRNFLHLAIRFGGRLEQFFIQQTASALVTHEQQQPQQQQQKQQQQQQQQQQQKQQLPQRVLLDQELASTISTTTITAAKVVAASTASTDPGQPLQQENLQQTSSAVLLTKSSSDRLPIRASKSHRIQDMQLLLDEKDENGCTPLHYASKAGHLLAIEELIKLGATPSLKNNLKQSPFHFAARYGRYNTCRRLLDLAQGPNIMNETDSDGLTGLHIAAQNGHIKIISLLMERGAVIHRDNNDNTPVHHAAAQGWTQSMRIMLTIHHNLIDVKNVNGETALHVAAQNGQVRAVTLLLDMGAEIERDSSDKNFFDYVIEFKLCDIAMAVVRHDRWEEVLNTPSGPYGFPVLGLIEHMPLICEAVLDRCQVYSNHERNSADHYVEYNFRYLTCPAECIEQAKSLDDFNPLCTLNAMVKHGRVNCLSHPVCVKCLRLKWCTYGIWFYTLVLGLYMLFLTSLTIFVTNNDSLRHFDGGDVGNTTVAMLSGNQKKLDISVMSKCLMWVVAAFSVLSIIKEVFQMITQGLRYCVDYQNYLEWALYVSSMLFSTPMLLGYSFHWQWEAGACAIFLAWFNLLVMLQRFDFFGIYVIMFLEIFRTLLQALCVFSVLIVAFGLSFYILLNHEQTNAYSSPGLSILRTAMMMLELDYMASFNAPYTDDDSTSLHFGGLTMAMVVLFVLIMPILLINLLIGLAVGDIEAVQRNARLKRIAGQVEMHTDMERKMPLFLLSRLSHTVYRHYPNRCGKTLLNLWSRLGDKDDHTEFFDSKQATTLDELVKQKHKMKEMSSTIEKNNQLLRLIMQKMEIHTEDDAWDEGFRADRDNNAGCLPAITDSPPSAARNITRTIGRNFLYQASIVSYMKSNTRQN